MYGSLWAEAEDELLEIGLPLTRSTNLLIHSVLEEKKNQLLGWIVYYLLFVCLFEAVTKY